MANSKKKTPFSIPKIIDKDYLEDNPKVVFVFGDNIQRSGYGGAAVLRDCINAYGFITKKRPDNGSTSFFKPEEYKLRFEMEIKRLEKRVTASPNTTFLVSALGAGLANRYNIYEEVIEEGLKEFSKKFKNVKLLKRL